MNGAGTCALPGCGVSFVTTGSGRPRVFCGRAHLMDSLRAPERTRVCALPGCGLIMVVRGRGKVSRKYCSREHLRDDEALRYAAPSRSGICALPGCDVTWTTSGKVGSQREFCSHEHRMKVANARRPVGLPRTSACREPGCDVPIVTVGRGRARKSCSPEHSHPVAAGIRSAARRVGVVALAARDGWDCHLCGQPIDSGLRGRSRLAVSIDHVVPVSMGGLSEPSNLRLAHRGCNARRQALAVEVARVMFGSAP